MAGEDICPRLRDFFLLMMNLIYLELSLTVIPDSTIFWRHFSKGKVL